MQVHRHDDEGRPCRQGHQCRNFNALVSDLVAALDRFHVAAKDKQTLLGVLGPMQSDIVEK